MEKLEEPERNKDTLRLNQTVGFWVAIWKDGRSRVDRKNMDSLAGELAFKYRDE